MSQAKTYRLGNQSREYEISEEYLGWIPESMKNWGMFRHEYALGRSFPTSITLVSPKDEKKTFKLHQRLIKEAFPLSFFGEARADNWTYFLMVSEEETPELKFIIPMH